MFRSREPIKRYSNQGNKQTFLYYQRILNVNGSGFGCINNHAKAQLVKMSTSGKGQTNTLVFKVLRSIEHVA